MLALLYNKKVSRGCGGRSLFSTVNISIKITVQSSKQIITHFALGKSVSVSFGVIGLNHAIIAADDSAQIDVENWLVLKSK